MNATIRTAAQTITRSAALAPVMTRDAIAAAALAPSDAWGATIERSARFLAAPLAAVITAAIAAYAAGFALGSALHRLNDQLAALFRAALAPEAAAPQQQEPEALAVEPVALAVAPQQEPEAQQQEPEALAVASLDDYRARTAQDLRRLCRGIPGAYRFTRAQALAALALREGLAA